MDPFTEALHFDSPRATFLPVGATGEFDSFPTLSHSHLLLPLSSKRQALREALLAERDVIEDDIAFIRECLETEDEYNAKRVFFGGARQMR